MTRTLVLFAILASGMGYSLARYWESGQDSPDRVLIVAAAIWAATELPAVPRVRRVPIVGWLAMLLGLAMILVDWFVLLRLGQRHILLWWYAIGMLGLGVGWLIAERGLLSLWRHRFMLLFPFLALPMPGRIYLPLQASLQDFTTTVAAAGLPLIGIPVVRDGFLLTLPGGALGVVEACSGIRSVVALVAIAIFLAYLFGLGFWRGLIVVGLSFPVIVLVNALRVIITGAMSEWIGPDAIVGWKHELLGFIMVLVGLGFIGFFTKLLAPKPTPTTSTATPIQSRDGWVSTIILMLGTVGFVGVTCWPIPPTLATNGLTLSNERSIQNGWTIEPGTVPENIQEVLFADTMQYRIGTDRIGHSAHAWLMYWSGNNGARGYHTPDVCWPSRGFTLVRIEPETIKTPKGRSVEFLCREFARADRRQIVVTLKQEGRRPWTDADDAANRNPLLPIRWLQTQSANASRSQVDDRLAYLVAADVLISPSDTQKRLLQFSANFADELYDACPWADPLLAELEASR